MSTGVQVAPLASIHALLPIYLGQALPFPCPLLGWASHHFSKHGEACSLSRPYLPRPSLPASQRCVQQLLTTRTVGLLGLVSSCTHVSKTQHISKISQPTAELSQLKKNSEQFHISNLLRKPYVGQAHKRLTSKYPDLRNTHLRNKRATHHQTVAPFVHQTLVCTCAKLGRRC